MIIKLSIRTAEHQRTQVDSRLFDDGDISFYAEETEMEVEKLETKGLCMKCYKADITTRGIDYSAFKEGDLIRIGSLKARISMVGKPCYLEECGIYDSEKRCIMLDGTMFADVVEPGEAALGEEIHLVSE